MKGMMRKFKKGLSKLPPISLNEMGKDLKIKIHAKYFNDEEILEKKVKKDKDEIILHIKMLEPFYEVLRPNGEPVTIHWLDEATLGELQDVLEQYVLALKEDVGEI